MKFHLFFLPEMSYLICKLTIFILRAYTAPALVYLGRTIYDMFSLLLIDLVFRS